MTPLEQDLRRRIAADGPLPVEAVMAEALAAYYHSRDPLGQAGDFTTAPEISQMFGEMLGLWAAVCWQQIGCPAPVILAEIGPGRGTLMADALRAARMVPAFAAALSVHLVETSPTLRARQRETLAGVDVTWHDSLDDLPAGPLILLANEFLDALPIRQAVLRDGQWRERMIGLDEADALCFLPGAEVSPGNPAALLEDAAEGAIVEWSPACRAVIATLSRRLAVSGGYALFLDYGPEGSAIGDSLQAVRDHRYHPVLQDLGDADLTAHVDFAALAEAARSAGAAAFGPLTQGELLRRLGIEQRAEMLVQGTPAKKLQIGLALRRLIHPTEMGTLFKALALTHPASPPPPGFDA